MTIRTFLIAMTCLMLLMVGSKLMFEHFRPIEVGDCVVDTNTKVDEYLRKFTFKVTDISPDGSAEGVVVSYIEPARVEEIQILFVISFLKGELVFSDEEFLTFERVDCPVTKQLPNFFGSRNVDEG